MNLYYNHFDKALFVISCCCLIYKTNFLLLLDFLAQITYLELYVENFTSIEKCIVAHGFCILYSKEIFLINPIRYHMLVKNKSGNLFFDMLEILLFFIIDPLILAKDYFNLFYTNIAESMYKILAFLFCMLVQYYGEFFISKNLKRKIFHVFLFFYFYTCTKYSINIALLTNLILLFVSTHWNAKLMFKSYINNKDHGKYVLSHIYILSACLYPYFLLEQNKYHCLLISVCFQDAFASIAGKFINSKKKSFFGFFVGFVASIIIHYFVFGYFDRFFYFLIMGIVEYLTEQNDNLVIPYVSVILFKCGIC